MGTQLGPRGPILLPVRRVVDELVDPVVMHGAGLLEGFQGRLLLALGLHGVAHQLLHEAFQFGLGHVLHAGLEATLGVDEFVFLSIAVGVELDEGVDALGFGSVLLDDLHQGGVVVQQYLQTGFRALLGPSAGPPREQTACDEKADEQATVHPVLLLGFFCQETGPRCHRLARIASQVMQASVNHQALAGADRVFALRLRCLSAAASQVTKPYRSWTPLVRTIGVLEVIFWRPWSL